MDTTDRTLARVAVSSDHLTDRDIEVLEDWAGDAIRAGWLDSHDADDALLITLPDQLSESCEQHLVVAGVSNSFLALVRAGIAGRIEVLEVSPGGPRVPGAPVFESESLLAPAA